MFKVPVWILEQVAKAGKAVNPGGLLEQTNVDDLTNLAQHVAHHLLGW